MSVFSHPSTSLVVQHFSNSSDSLVLLTFCAAREGISLEGCMSFVLPWKSIDEFGSCCWKQAVKLPGEEIKEGETLPCHFKCSFSVLFQFITF